MPGKIEKIRERSFEFKMTALILAIVLLLTIPIDMIFVYYRRRLSSDFEYMESENLTSYAQEQSQYVQTILAQIKGRMESTAKIIGNDDRLSEENYQGYLESINTVYQYKITYTDIDSAFAIVSDEEAPADDMEIYQNLLQGEDIMSPIQYSTRLGDYYFAMGQPVVVSGEVTGILRCVIPASVLLSQTEDTEDLYKIISMCIVDNDGKILFSDSEEYRNGITLQEELQNKSVCGDTLEQLRGIQNAGESGSIKVCANEGKTIFLSTAYLGYKDWNLVRFTSVEKMDEIYKSIYNDTIMLAVVLIAVTVIIICIVMGVIKKQKRRETLEAARYNAVSHFSDIILFNYVEETDTLNLSPNVYSFMRTDSCTVYDFVKNKTLSGVHEESLERLFAAFKESSDDAFHTIEIKVLRPDEDIYFWCECQLKKINPNGEIIGKLTDISQRKEKEIALLNKSKTDMLTGLYNRESLKESISALIGREQCGYVFMIDVDNFKEVNDHYGHVAGDELLVAIGDMLRKIFRKDDLVGRIGGDEFVAFLFGKTSRETVQIKAERILNSMYDEKNKKRAVTFSIGIAVCPENGKTYEDLFIAADNAMYYAKKNGKNRYAFAGDENDGPEKDGGK